MEIDNVRANKLRDYLMDIISEIDSGYKQINVDYLSNDVSNYSLDKIPTGTVIQTWITGDVIHRDVYSFRSRMNYSAEVISNISNIGFFETFERKIKQKNDSGDLPDIAGIESIQCLNCGTLILAGSNTAEFNIQIEIQYREVEEPIQPSL